MLRSYSLLAMMTACLSLTAGAGCERVYVPATGLDGPRASNPLPQVTVHEGLGKDVVFSQPQVNRLPGDPLRVVVPIQARGNNDLAVQYRFRFFDEAGNPLDQSTGWQNMLLSAWVQRHMDGVSATDEARDWQLEIRPAQ